PPCLPCGVTTFHTPSQRTPEGPDGSPSRTRRAAMSRFPCRLTLLCAFVVSGFASAQESSGDKARKAEAPVSAEGAAFFEKKIRPVLVAECYACHSADKGKKVRGGLA